MVENRGPTKTPTLFDEANDSFQQLKTKLTPLNWPILQNQSVKLVENE